MVNDSMAVDHLDAECIAATREIRTAVLRARTAVLLWDLHLPHPFNRGATKR